MTRTHTLALASALVAIALASAAPAHAQGGPPVSGTDPHRPPRSGMEHDMPMMGRMMGRHGPPPSVDERVQRMSGELNLTADQTAKVKALLLAEQRSADSLRAVRAVQMEAEHKAMEARHAEHEKALLAILTPEQKVKHEALMKQRGPGGFRGRGMGAPGTPPAGPDRRPGNDDGPDR